MDWKHTFKEGMLGAYIDPDKILDNLELKFQNIPKKLFKYRTFDAKGNSLKNLESSTVWMNSPQNFNDPYDCALTVNFYKLSPDTLKELDEFLELVDYPKNERDAILPTLIQSGDPFQALVKEMASRKLIDTTLSNLLISTLEERHDTMVRLFSERTKTLTHVCSFCETPNSILMWAHYAENHTGFCVEYDFTSEGSNSLNTRFLYPVYYSKDLHDHSKHMIDIDRSKANPLSIVLPAITKSTEWSYEKEWRLVYSNGVMKRPQSLKVPKAVRVYAGVKISEEHYQILQEKCRDLDIPIHKMKMSHTIFSVIPEEI
ncbi:DUF2971 domain-containing protein [Pseudomonas entomophila]|uniref:DUF2971 domain-containing protein n=1 Tax=Pseudomonas entomophila TaxID=312306 RepID=UPI003EBE746A